MSIIKANFHTHTNFCDGTDSAEDIVKQAIAYGFSTLGFSSHLDPDPTVSIRDYKGYLTEIYRLQEKYKDQIEIICGVELDNLLDPKLAEGTEYYIGSNHYFNIPGLKELCPVDYSPEKTLAVCQEYFDGDFYKLAKKYYEDEATVCARLHPTFIGHFDLVTRYTDSHHFFDTSDIRYRKPALEAMEYLVSKEIPFEVNCGAVNRGRKKELYPDMFLLKSLKDFGGEIMINSDAHQKELLNGAFDEAVEAALTCGFDHVNILTKEGTGQLHFKQIGIK